MPDLAEWLSTPLGQYLLQREQTYFDREVADIFGFNALQLGLPETPAKSSFDQKAGEQPQEQPASGRVPAPFGLRWLRQWFTGRGEPRDALR